MRSTDLVALASVLVSASIAVLAMRTNARLQRQMASQNEFNVAKRWLLDRTLQTYCTALTATHQLWGKVAEVAGDQVGLQELENTMTDYSPERSRGIIENDLLLPTSVKDQCTWLASPIGVREPEGPGLAAVPGRGWVNG
jgi:hypothetical protein